jgi:biotin synthase-related radical SAM superfamily protein
MITEEAELSTQESPEYVRISLAAAMTLGLVKGEFYRGAKLYCLLRAIRSKVKRQSLER